MAKAAENLSLRLKKQRNRLITDLLNGEPVDFLGTQAAILDDYFRACFETSKIGPQLDIVNNPYALIALGGYGRSEQCVFSDVDLLILFEKDVPKEAENLVRETIYPLWDIGLEVGYATRSIKDCLDLAVENYEVLTSMLDARIICGISRLFISLTAALRSDILLSASDDIVYWLIENNLARHRRLGDSTHLLEPNLKEGQGGLRDYHTMLWIARIKSNIKHRRDLEYYGYLSNDEYRIFRKALAFVWQVRNRLHEMSGRKCDQLYYEDQIQLAAALSFKPETGQEPVEVFLGRLHGQMATIKELHQMFLHEQGYAIRRTLPRSPMIPVREEGVKVIRHKLAFTSSEAIMENPSLLMKIFEESARVRLPLGLEAKRLVTEFGHLADAQFSRSGRVIRSFEKILATPTPVFSVLNAMLRTGLLVRFIPEFKGIADRIQYNEYHLYPVDLHSLKTISLLKTYGEESDASGDSLCGKLYTNLADRRVLLFGALLHDIGKGKPCRNHSATGAGMAARVITRLGYPPADAETVAFLVRHHLLLVKTATRRDLNDEQTAIACARRIKDVNRLKMLYLLAVADSMATGPKAWTTWTASLLRDLFFKVLNILERGELASRAAVKTVETKKVEILKSAATVEERQLFESLFKFMSPRYMLYVPATDIREHMNLYRDLGCCEFVWRIKPDRDPDIREVTICALDRPGLISKIAGVFTLDGINILDTQVFTWRNHIALDAFRVEAPLDRIFESERWERTAGHLADALSGKLDLAEALKSKLERNRSAAMPAFGRPNRVVVDNDSSSFFTIIEVYTYDFPGLLYSVSNALLQCKIDLWVGKIATYIDQVVDVFYVRDFDGQKLESARIGEIQSNIQRVLPGKREA